MVYFLPNHPALAGTKSLYIGAKSQHRGILLTLSETRAGGAGLIILPHLSLVGREKMAFLHCQGVAGEI